VTRWDSSEDKGGTVSDEYDEHAWHDDLVDKRAVREWIADVLPDISEVVGPVYVHQAKEWGITASFLVTDRSGEREVVFKAQWLRLFAGAAKIAELLDRVCPGKVPQLLAWEPRGDGAWALFAAFEGLPIHTLGDLCEAARTLAEIQVAAAAQPAAERAAVPRVGVRIIPRLYEAVLRDVRERQLSFFEGEGSNLAEHFGVPPDVVARMERFRPYIAAWTDELLSGHWPDSLDHVDLHTGNIIRQPAGGILIYDWEEANLSCPFFSLDRLLDDARELEEPASRPESMLYTAAERAVRDAYLAALPWGDAAGRERGFDLAMCLAPIKTAYEGMVLAETLGWEEGSPHITAWALGRALPRWWAMSGSSRGDRYEKFRMHYG
jgi:Phosphotransferase enzyme family